MAYIDDRLASAHVEDKCFSLQRTNPRLGGNIKVVIWDESTAFIESISSSDYLSNQDFKAIPISFGMSHPRNVQKLAQKAASLNYWYDIDFSTSLGTSSYDSQYSQKYDWGAYTEPNPLSPGRYRFFAPIWVESAIPDRFLIFKTANTEFSDLQSYFKTGTLIKSIDLTASSKIGKYLRDFIGDKDWKRWQSRVSYVDKSGYHGISLERGVLTTYYEDRANSYLANERTLTEFNNEITNAWSRGKMISHKLINLEFSFDDESSEPGFNNYVGVYVFNDQIDVETATQIDQQGKSLGRVPIILNTNDVDAKLFDPNSVLPPYYVDVASNLIVDTRQDYAPILTLDLISNPDANSKIVLRYNGQVEVEIKFLVEDLDQDINVTRRKLVERINSYSFQAANISFRSFIFTDSRDQHQYIIVQMQQNSSVLESVTATVPPGIRAIVPETKVPLTEISFVGVDSRDAIIKEYVDIRQIDRVIVGNNTANSYVPVHYHEYLGNRILRLENFNPTERITNEMIKLQALKQSQILRSSILKHRDFDLCTLDHYYTPILDWDLAKFKAYLLNIVNSDGYVGAWTPSAPFTLAQYKATITNAINSYFDPIKQTDELLIKDIDPITLEATATVANEFDRFKENEIIDFLNKNCLESFVAKWALSDGTNAYAQPYGLNTNIAFRSDNFAPSHKAIQRDINNHSHSWFLIGEGPNPYEDRLHVQLSYSRDQITLGGLMSKTEDEFNKLKVPITFDNESTNYAKHAWSNFYLKEGTADTYQTFFRGLNLEVNGDFSGYRFAAILLSRDAWELESESDMLEIVVNRQFKFVSLVIKFQVPDPILTMLERGKDFYYLDRSLLYYVDAVLQSQLVFEVFGTARISLNLYDTDIAKSIDNIPVVDNMWHTTYNGEIVFWVGRGDYSVFGTSFRDLMLLNGEFSWRHIFRNEFNEEVITKFTATGIVFIEQDYFWCKDIKMELYTGQTRFLKADYFNWSGEGTLLDKDNQWYISKAISYYNSIYDSIVTARENVNRYKKSAFGSIINLLERNKIKTTFVQPDGDVFSEMTIRPIRPVYTYFMNARKEVDGVIVPTEKMIAYPVYRYDAYYGPIFKDLHTPLSSNLGSNLYFGPLMPSTRYIKKVAKIGLINLVESYSESYLRSIFSKSIYRYWSDEDSSISITTLINREEYRSLVSSIFKYNDSFDISINATVNRVINLVPPLRQLMFGTVFGSETMSDDEKVQSLTLYYDITMINKDQFDEGNIMFRNFYESYLSKIYRVSQVKVNGAVVPFKYLDKYSIELSQDYENITISFKR